MIWTDAAQVIIMIGGGLVLMFKSTSLRYFPDGQKTARDLHTSGFEAVGGWPQLTTKYFRAVPEINYTIANAVACSGVPPEDSFHLFRPIDDADYPWTGIVFGLTVSAVWYWCSDQVSIEVHGFEQDFYTHRVL